MSNETLMKMMYGTKRQFLVGDQLDPQNNYPFMSCVLVEVGAGKMIKDIILMLTIVQMENLQIRIKKPPIIRNQVRNFIQFSFPILVPI